jgi:hypothetical protein
MPLQKEFVVHRFPDFDLHRRFVFINTFPTFVSLSTVDLSRTTKYVFQQQTFVKLPIEHRIQG